MEERIIVTKLQENLYLLDDANEATGYLLIGEEKACLIDTMLGYDNLLEIVRRYTDKPVVVVNTHGHPDHIFGNIYFEKAYMNFKDLKLAKECCEDPEFRKACEENGMSMPPFENLQEGDVIDLGGRTLKIYDIPGHTEGGILLLCPEERILFTGDSINHHLWMQLEECLSLQDMANSLERLLFLETEADRILHGHAKGFDNITLMRAMLNAIKDILDGKTEKDSDYPWFEGVDTKHPYLTPEDDPENPGENVIVYKKGQY